MQKVLYLTNIVTPYRSRFFAEMAKYCELTVIFERSCSSNRDLSWREENSERYRSVFLKGIHIRHENAFSFAILKHLFSDYDKIIVGCFNSPVQIFAILVMRLFQIPYVLNLDGDPFIHKAGWKTSFKRFVLRGAEKYLVAGETTADQILEISLNKEVVPYYFSSLSSAELDVRTVAPLEERCKDTILVVGQYFLGKGMDVALSVARMDPDHKYKFIGMGVRTEQFLQDHSDEIPANVNIIPFLNKGELEAEYRTCCMLLLPSREDCWGLVINEAASFGAPIVSTWGSGAAVEFLSQNYPQYLAQPDNAEDLLRCIRRLTEADNINQYAKFLYEKTKAYSIERGVESYIQALNLKRVGMDNE